MEYSSVVTCLDDDDHVEQHNDVALQDKILLLCLSLCLFVLVSLTFLMFVRYSSYEDDLFLNINEHFKLDVVAGDLIIMDFLLTSRTFSFVATGDLFWYQSYWQFVESDARMSLADNFFYSPIVSAAIKTKLAAPQKSVDSLSHFQRISQSIASQVFNHTHYDVSYVFDYKYDIEREQSIKYDRVDYDGYTNWYTNHTHDSLLSSSEKYLIAKETVSSSRYHDLLDSNVNALFQTSQLFDIESMQGIDRLFIKQRFLLLYLLSLHPCS
ncbi:hypothetical protein GEMRC1_013918 [Eukaryota sp. GEM-RC1]